MQSESSAAQNDQTSNSEVEKLVEYINDCLERFDVGSFSASRHQENDDEWIVILCYYRPDCFEHPIMQVRKEDRKANPVYVESPMVPHWIIEVEHHIPQTYHEPEDWDWKELAATQSTVEAAKMVFFYLIDDILNQAMGVREE